MNWKPLKNIIFPELDCKVVLKETVAVVLVFIKLHYSNRISSKAIDISFDC
jgi:hypothetical protein